MNTPKLRSNQLLISQVLHGPNMFSSPSSTFRPPPIVPMFKFCKKDKWKSLIGVGIFQGFEEV